MISDWVEDIARMHEKFGVNKTVRQFDEEKLRTFLRFRLDFLKEEMRELEDAFQENDSEEIVDALIDLCVVAIGTLDAFDVDSRIAWNAVHNANMAKLPGIKASRPNPLGLPDMIKPEGWQGPSHVGNHGLLEKINGKV